MAAEHKTQRTWKVFTEKCSVTKSEIEQISADLGPVMRTDFEVRGQNYKKYKRRRNVHTQIKTNFKYTFVDVQKANYFNLNNGLRPAMFNISEQILCKGTRSLRNSAVKETQMHNVFQTKPRAEMLVQNVMYNTASFIKFAKTVGKLVNRSNQACHLSNFSEEASTTTSHPELSKKGLHHV